LQRLVVIVGEIAASDRKPRVCIDGFRRLDQRSEPFWNIRHDRRPRQQGTTSFRTRRRRQRRLCQLPHDAYPEYGDLVA
jgi:hypothetical protein